MAEWNRRKWLRAFGLGTASMFVAPGLLVPGLLADEPQITRSPLNKLSDEQEIELGRRFATELEKEEPVVSSLLIDRYLNALVRDLASHSQRPNLPYAVKLINSHEPNACSLPGGFLYVNRGLIEMIGSEDELAATLAHEIGHVVGRHAVNQLLLSFSARALLKPVLDNLNKHNGVIESIILQFGGALAMLAMLHFSRQDEAQADLLGLYEMLRAGRDPRGFLKLFAQLEELQESSGSAPIAFLSDHPPTPERAAAIRHELAQLTIPAGASADSMKFQTIKMSVGLLPESPKVPAHHKPQS